MNVLHLSNDFPNSALYKQLVLHLDELDVQQTIYSAVRTEKEAQYSAPELSHLEDIKIRNILRPYDRFLYRNKIRKIFQNIINSINLGDVDLVHAHTLYSDGGVAFQVKKKFNIPYIVAVRNTDINAFQKYRLDLRFKRNEILREAEKVIFISPAYEQKFLEVLSNSLRQSVKAKAEVIPNGLDPLFLEYSAIPNKRQQPTLKLLFVGDFRKLKNVPTLIKAVDILHEQNKSVALTIVGEGGDEGAKVKKMIASENYPFTNYLGRIIDREKLRNIYADHDIFVMVSKRETFGLAYIEALSQGLPIVYTNGEGIDGYFDKGMVGLGIDNIQDPDEIASKIQDLSAHLNLNLIEQCMDEAQQFKWEKISDTYKDIYDTILNEKR